MRFAWISCALATLVLGACGDDGTTGDDAPAVDANDANFTELIGRDWTIAPGEGYRCVSVRVEQDMLIKTFRATAPSGTHHTVLSVGDSGPAGEDDNCSPGTFEQEMLFASGVGTDDLRFPDGVAIRVEAGRYLHLNLHLFNTQASGDLSGHSGILVETVDVVDPDKEAEMVFTGRMLFTIDANSSTDISGGCTFDEPATLLAYWPHMHQYATHQRVNLSVGGTVTTLHDAPFSFAEQRNYVIEPTAVSAGDSIDVVCSYTNNTNVAVEFGDSSTKEMCFTGLYRYPKQAVSKFECSAPCTPITGCPL